MSAINLSPDPSDPPILGANPLLGDTNLLAYAGDDPIGTFDPDGLAKCVYSVSTHHLRCRSNAGGPLIDVGPDGVGSGLGPCANNPACEDRPEIGPIQEGTYKMNKDDRPGHSTWWRLEAQPHPSGLAVRTGFARGGFALHQGSHSLGCINVDKNNPDAVMKYKQIQDLLKKEAPNNMMYVIP